MFLPTIQDSARLMLATLLLTLANAAAFAQARVFPDRPIRIIVPYAAGSGSDAITRVVAVELQAVLGQSVIVDNRPGANGIIGTEAVANALPDGYTLLLASATAQTINPHLYRKLPYDPIKDFSAVARLCSLPYVLAVDARLPVGSMREFLDWTHRPAASVTYAYANGPSQIAASMLARQAGFQAVGASYKSAPQAMSDVAAGQVHFMFTDLAGIRPFLQSDRLRPLAIASEKRSSLMPRTPTVEEASGLQGFDLVTWIGLLGPAKLPADIAQKLNTAVNTVLEKQEVVKQLANLGADVWPASVPEMKVYMTQQLDVWGKRVREAGIETQ
jgi:tripartite-type tricarboxylate transporter receptor subunit TctC